MTDMTPSKIFFWIGLSGLTHKKQTELLHGYGGPEGLYARFLEEQNALVGIIGDRHYAALKRYRSADYIGQALDKLRKDGIYVMTAANPKYPECLRQAEAAAPYALYYRGNPALLETRCAAVVGTRRCCGYGRQMAEEIAGTLAENGVTVVSGLATGIDGYAHRAALDNSGGTIAVLGSGLNCITPAGHVQLYDRILAGGGLVLSQYKPTDNATRFTFPERNRIVSGLCEAVVIVEAPEGSGALITARFASEQGRDVLVVPGNVTDARFKGSNQLLYEGAVFVRGGADVLEFMRIAPKSRQNSSPPQLDKAQEMIYSLICSGVESFDRLIEAGHLSPAELAAVLLDLELFGVVKKTGAEQYSRSGP
ncbi:MAG: DNA-processing protein DprA [Clostridiales bacterium]|jgi:DNA processing protein|nr:DNA-processing protein DprA [Clostridiales bacterium]